jgi:hypothetical protein
MNEVEATTSVPPSAAPGISPTTLTVAPPTAAPSQVPLAPPSAAPSLAPTAPTMPPLLILRRLCPVECLLKFQLLY